MSKQRGLKVAPTAGTKVRLTGYFLKCTGQVKGEEGSKRWTVLDPSESGFAYVNTAANRRDAGTFVYVDEEIDAETQAIMFSDIKSTRADGRLMRSINIGNLEIVGALPKAADQADDVPPVKVS
jgi:hypothetical protein